MPGLSTPRWPAGILHVNVGVVLVTFLAAVTKYLAKTLKEGRLIWARKSRVKSIMVGQPWKQKLWAADHCTPVDKQEIINADWRPQHVNDTAHTSIDPMLYLFFFIIFGTRSHYGIPVDLELHMETRMILNSQSSACLFSAGIKGIYHHS